MEKILKALTKGERFIFENQFGYSGEFSKALWQVMSVADKWNLAKLHMGFPEEVDAFLCFREIAGWWQNLVKKVNVLLGEERFKA